VKNRVATTPFRQATSQSVDHGITIRSVAAPQMTWAAHGCGTRNPVAKEDEMTNTTKLVAKPGVPIALMGNLALRAATPSRAL
jgi:hypothetical protein